MASAVKKMMTSLKRKSDALTTPLPNKKSKVAPSESSRLDSESVSGAPTFNANVVPSTYKPKKGEIVKDFNDFAEGQSLVSQAHDFYKSASKIAIENGAEWEGMHRYKTAVCKSDMVRGLSMRLSADRGLIQI